MTTGCEGQPGERLTPKSPGVRGTTGRLPLLVWGATALLFATTYFTVWSVVHGIADSRACMARLPDPLYPLIPYVPELHYISWEGYVAVTLAGGLALAYRAWRGDHVPLVRWGAALVIMGWLRALCILLVPLCQWDVAPGTVAVSRVPRVELGPFDIPWRMRAINDLLFSGHVGEVFLLLLAGRHWPRWARIGAWIFQLLQSIALLSTRGHYTIDIILAFPCAYFADAMAVAFLCRTIARSRRTSTRSLATVGRGTWGRALRAARAHVRS